MRFQEEKNLKPRGKAVVNPRIPSPTAIARPSKPSAAEGRCLNPRHSDSLVASETGNEDVNGSMPART